MILFLNQNPKMASSSLMVTKISIADLTVKAISMKFFIHSGLQMM